GSSTHELGHAERVRDRRERIPAERRLQPDRDRGRFDLPGGRGGQNAGPEKAGRAGLTDSGKGLSPRGGVAGGAGRSLAGVALSARGGYVLAEETHKFASDAMAIVPVGMVLAFAGLLLAVPPRFARLRAFAGAVLMTAFALTFDWIAFGPGTREFGGGIV